MSVLVLRMVAVQSLGLWCCPQSVQLGRLIANTCTQSSSIGKYLGEGVHQRHQEEAVELQTK